MLFELHDVGEGAVSKVVEVVPIPLHPIIFYSFLCLYFVNSRQYQPKYMYIVYIKHINKQLYRSY